MNISNVVLMVGTALVLCSLNIHCAKPESAVRDHVQPNHLERQAIMLREAAAIAKSGHREDAVNIARKANALSIEIGLQRRRFRYDVPSSWNHISDGNPVFTVGGYAAERRQAAELAAAAMGLLVELGQDQQFDFSKDLGESDPILIRFVVREQAVRGHAAAAAKWGSCLPTDEQKHNAQIGITEAANRHGGRNRDDFRF